MSELPPVGKSPFSLHPSAFEYFEPTEQQKGRMAFVREQFATLYQHLDANLPNSPDKTHTLRLLRTTSMWAMVALTRYADGTPRS